MNVLKANTVVGRVKICLAAAMIMLSAAGAIAQTRSDSIRARFLDGKGKDVLVVCHRGDWRGYAENSLEGINSAIDMGVDVVEIDLRRTADGELILMHDSRIDRSTTGKGKVAELTLDSIKNVYLRSGVGERTPYRVPTLREVLVDVKGRVMLNLDKAADYFDQVWQLAEETGTTSQIIMKSTAPAADIKAKYGQYLDRIIYIPVVRLDKPRALEIIKENEELLNCPAYEVTFADSLSTMPPKVNELIGGKKRIWYNSLWSTLAGGHDDFASLVDPAEGYGYLLDNGATVIQTDQPAYLIRYLKSIGRRDEDN